jgi:hypothetical protein
MLYTKEIKKPVLNKLCDSKIIICIIINISLIVMTHSIGEFPQIIWIKQLLAITPKKEESGKDLGDEYDQVLMRVMEVCWEVRLKISRIALRSFGSNSDIFILLYFLDIHLS